MTALSTETRSREIPEIPRMSWDEFIATELRWRLGEHVGLIGPTGSGKTTLLTHILEYRKFVCVICTKPKDTTADAFIRNGYRRFTSWPVSGKWYEIHKSNAPRESPKRVLWPDAKRLDSAKTQRIEIAKALIAIYHQGGWCVAIDELWYFIHMLGLEKVVRTFLQQARALDISLVLATQRPAFVPLEVYDQSTHLFFWRDNDERNLKRISGISWLSSRLIQSAIANLEKHECLYINTRDGKLVRTMSPPPKGSEK